MTGDHLEATWRDVVWVLFAFWLPPSTIFTYLMLREVGRLRREREALQTEAETEAAEGYPPPDPPTA